MEILRAVQGISREQHGCALSIGNFDGVHLGHRAVLQQLQSQASGLGLPATVLTFEPTPREYFDPVGAPPRLTTLREKLCALEADGSVSRAVIARFDQALAAQSPESFCRQLLVQKLGVRYVIVGADFRFGHRRSGGFAELAAFGERFGFEVVAAPTFEIDATRVSSTIIRAALQQGDLDTAQRMLGRPYSMIGRVRRGEGLGRKLGYPTANIAPGRLHVPLQGIFAVRVRRAPGQRYQGVASLGTRPTVNGSAAVLEVHLFDFSGDLYGARLEVQFIARLREERYFPDLHKMVEQMHRDAAEARRLLQHTDTPEP